MRYTKRYDITLYSHPSMSKRYISNHYELQLFVLADQNVQWEFRHSHALYHHRLVPNSRLDGLQSTASTDPPIRRISSKNSPLLFEGAKQGGNFYKRVFFPDPIDQIFGACGELI